MSSPPDPAPRQLPLSILDLLLILIVGIGAVRLLAGIAMISLGWTDPTQKIDGTSVLIATVALLVVQAVALLLIIYAVAIRKRDLSWADLGLFPADRRWYGWAVATGILLVPAVSLVNLAIAQIQGAPFENPQIGAIAPAGFTWTGVIVMTFAAGVVTPYAEEIAFRGLFFAWLRERIGLIAAVAGSAVFFASLHGLVQLIPSLALIGATFAVLYHRCGSIYPVMVAHGIFNAIMVIALYASLAGVTAGH